MVHLLDRLIADNPDFHHLPDGTPANWAVSEAALRFLYRCLAPGMSTLETGAGQTTIIFALSGTHHVCITPQHEHTARVRAYLARQRITGTVTFIHESSDSALVQSRLIPEVLDLVFIDGAHRFPFPCLDWHYTERRLRVGGIVGVDDCRMPSVKILHDFLCGEDEWELIEIAGQTSFFKKLGIADVTFDCRGQRINQPLY
ncbi:MAG: class I SAM-dependent methyltransferase [Nitrospirota bacterium]